MVDRELESCGHDADHRVGNARQVDRTPEDVRIAAESRLPRLVPDHDHRRRRSGFVSRQQVAPHDRRRARDGKPGRRHFGHPDRLGRSVWHHQVVLSRAKGAELLH